MEGDLTLLERVPCNLCGADDPQKILSEGSLDLVRCRRCDLVYVSPRLKETHIHQLYDDDYFQARDSFVGGERGFKGGYRDYIADQVCYLKTFNKRMDALEKHTKTSGRLLDIGCAAGFFLKVAQERGWQVEGIEPAKCVADHARSMPGVKIYKGTFEETTLPASFYNLITIWDTLEHMLNPMSTLSRVQQLLKPEGLVVVSTQNISSLLARTMGKRWHHIGNHLHLYHFSPKTIRALMSASGFYVISITKGSAGKFCSCRFLVDKLSSINQTLYKTVNGFLMVIPTLAERSVYINAGDEMIVYARKK